MVILIAVLAGAACFLLAAPPVALELGSLDRHLRERRLPLTAHQYVALWAVLPAAVIALVRLLTGSWLTAAIAIPIGPLVISGLFDSLSRRRTQAMRDQLQEMLLSLATSLKAGQSLRNALERCVVDLRRLHPRGSQIERELALVVREVQMGVPVDEALLVFRERVPLEEVSSLVDAVVITRRRGGNTVAVMANVAHMLADRLAIDREVQVMTAQKRAEAAILSLIPLGIYLITRVTNPAYMAPFHETPGGQIALGVIFLAITAGYRLAHRLARIDL